MFCIVQCVHKCFKYFIENSVDLDLLASETSKRLSWRNIRKLSRDI